jgi:hypothetical protein
MTLSPPPPLNVYPTARTTGPQTADTIVPWVGDFVTSHDFQLIDKINITGRLIVKHSGVILNNSMAQKGIENSGNKPFNGWNCRIGTPKGAAVGAGIKGSNITLRRCDVFGVIDALRSYDNWNVEDCYLHDLYRCPDSTQTSGWTHNDGVQVSAGSHLWYKHNRLECWTFVSGQIAGQQDRSKTTPQTTGMGFYTGGGDIRDVRIEDNIFLGNAYAFIAAVSKDGHTASDFIIINNKFDPKIDKKNWIKTSTVKNVTAYGNEAWSGQ